MFHGLLKAHLLGQQVCHGRAYVGCMSELKSSEAPNNYRKETARQESVIKRSEALYSEAEVEPWKEDMTMLMHLANE